MIGSSSYIVMDTDYDSYAMVCTCQDMDLFLTYAHRRSCSILQRSATEDAGVTEKMSSLLDGQIEEASHDFDRIKQDGCEYNKEKVLNIDVDKILGLKGSSEVKSFLLLTLVLKDINVVQVRDAVSAVASEFEFNSKSLEDIKKEAADIL